jgi:hypothetical protein
MPFVVKANLQSRAVKWLSHPGVDGLRYFLHARVAAQEFATRRAARAALKLVPRDFVTLGICSLSIEETKRPPGFQGPEPESARPPISN